MSISFLGILFWLGSSVHSEIKVVKTNIYALLTSLGNEPSDVNIKYDANQFLQVHFIMLEKYLSIPKLLRVNITESYWLLLNILWIYSENHIGFLFSSLDIMNYSDWSWMTNHTCFLGIKPSCIIYYDILYFLHIAIFHLEIFG